MSLKRPPFYFSAPVEFADAGEALPTLFSGIAYSGDIMREWLPIVIDLETTEIAPSMPLLYEHERDEVIGVVTTAEKAHNAIRVAGQLFSDIDEDAAMLAKKQQRGLKCQMSVGLFDTRSEEIAQGGSIAVNGREFQGPLTVLRNGLIREVSIVAIGADKHTNAQFFSALSTPPEDQPTMSDPNPLQATVDALQAQVDDLTARLAAAEAKASAAETARADLEASARKSEVCALFSAIGREPTDDAIKPYLALSAEAWAAVSADLKQFGKPEVPGYLFSEQAQGDTRTPKGPSLNPADIYAARRAN